MPEHDTVNTIAQVAIAAFTAVLVWVTYVLARHTKLLNAHDSEQKRLQDIRRSIFLAESIVSLDVEEFGDWVGRGVSSKSVHPFSELLTFSKYIHNRETKKQLEQTVSSLTFALSPGSDPVLWNKALLDGIERLRKQLPQEIMDWQRDLGNY